MKRFVLGAIGIAALLATAIFWPFDSPATSGASLAFEATFNTPADFYDRFDYGYSGLSPLEVGDSITHFHGDHNAACEGPTTLRDVVFGGSPGALDFSQLFWHCAPGGDPAKGHLMTGVDTGGYNIAWFSPKPFFSNVSGVCWDINLTTMSSRKWTQVLFVSQADAVRYPAGTVTTGGGMTTLARGSGGFDLGYTAPDFRQDAPNTTIFPQGGTLAGFRSLIGSAEWFQNQDTFTTRHQGPANIIRAGADKATRFTHCLSNEPGNIVRLTSETPAGTTMIRDMVGQIPPHPVRVVFQDDNYNPSKGDSYSPDALTWHWDNIQVFTGDGAVPTTTVATTAPTTVPTTAPTTVATTAPTTVATTAPTTVATTVATTAPTTSAAPTSAAPTSAAPTSAAPTSAAPTSAAPTTAAPTTPAPTTAAPTTAAPTTLAPTTAAPTTAAATTAAPTTLAPTTAAPTTAAPTTAAPTTAAPTTLAPTTAAPTTAAPTTAAPTTSAPTTAAPTTAAAATTAAAGTTAPAGAGAQQQQQAAAPPPNQPPAPNVTFTGGPAETTTERDAVITWDVSDFQATQEFAGLDDFTFTCSLDGADGRVCTSPARYLALDLGAHEVVVKAADRTNGAVGTARFRWTIVEGTDRSLTNRSTPLGAVDVGRLAAPSNVRSIPTPYAVPQAVPPSNQNADNATLSSTGARSIEIALVGLTMIAIGLVLAGAASVLRRRSA